MFVRLVGKATADLTQIQDHQEVTFLVWKAAGLVQRSGRSKALREMVSCCFKPFLCSESG